MSSISADRFEILEAFFNKIADLTVNHSVIETAHGDSYAVVYPCKLAEALKYVDPDWFEHRRGPETLVSRGNNDKK